MITCGGSSAVRQRRHADPSAIVIAIGVRDLDCFGGSAGNVSFTSTSVQNVGATTCIVVGLLESPFIQMSPCRSDQAGSPTWFLRNVFDACKTEKNEEDITSIQFIIHLISN